MSMVEIDKQGTGGTEPGGKQNKAVIPVQNLLSSASSSDDRLLATHGRTFHFAARFLPPKQRHLVSILYAFFRTLDDLVDTPEEGCCIEETRTELNAWKDWFTSGHHLPAPQEPLGGKLAEVLVEHPVPINIFIDFLDGLASDLEPREIRDFRELYRYCYCVAGTVGLAMAHILGASSPQALAAAQSLGIGMQLTNILRDVAADFAFGRIYIPQEDLLRFGCSRTHLFQLCLDQRGPDERFRALMSYQVARAHYYYVQGMSGIWLLPHNCRLPILVAGRVYRRILTAIEYRNHYDVLRSRARTSFLEKVYEAMIAFALDLLWRRGEASATLEMGIIFEEH